MCLKDLVRATALGGLVAVAMAVAVPAGAVPITVDWDDFDSTPETSPNSNNPQTVNVPPYFSMELNGAPSGQQIGCKNVGGVNAIGVTGGGSGNEIDLEQSITFDTFSLPVSLASFTLAFLFDGPEYDDVQEVARVTVSLAGGGMLSGTLTANFAGGYSWIWGMSLEGAYPR